MTSVNPSVSLTLAWNPPSNYGCLPIMHYRLNKAGTDLPTLISADSQSFADDISIGGTIGTSITYKLKAVNSAGDSPYTQDLIVTVG